MKEFSKLFTQVAVMDTEGNQTGIDIVEVSTNDVIRSAFGDKVLYQNAVKHVIVDGYCVHARCDSRLEPTGTCFGLVEVWPEGDSDE